MSGIADVNPDAVLSPSKLDIVAAWLPSQPWFTGDAAEAEIVGSYRFVDPDGEVGMESHLVRCGDTTYHVPLTYRGAPCRTPTTTSWAPCSTATWGNGGCTTHPATLSTTSSWSG